LYQEQTDAEEVKKCVEKEGRRCLLLPGDLMRSDVCTSIVTRTVEHFGKLDILVNNAAQQRMSYPYHSFDCQPTEHE
jgi:NAD(P)-dependent dehydrogenase (short-subunit alcohol dehydrogenase family)